MIKYLVAQNALGLGAICIKTERILNFKVRHNNNLLTYMNKKLHIFLNVTIQTKIFMEIKGDRSVVL